MATSLEALRKTTADQLGPGLLVRQSDPQNFRWHEVVTSTGVVLLTMQAQRLSNGGYSWVSAARAWDPTQIGNGHTQERKTVVPIRA